MFSNPSAETDTLEALHNVIVFKTENVSWNIYFAGKFK